MKWMKREQEHESVSLTILIVMTIVITAKLCIAGLTIGGHTFGPFDAMDWTTIFTPVAGLYFGQKIQHGRRKRSLGDEQEKTSNNQ